MGREFIERTEEWIGPYRLLDILGRGGFGVVWLVERRDPMVQRLALKVIKPGMDTRGVIARFEQERQALAVMDHPHIARVVDAGATAQGRPYFVMEYIRGEPITTFCDRNNVSIQERLKLVSQVCEALQHAHMKGIIHRDIKPTNILVCMREGTPAPTIIDFGVAKALSPGFSRKTVYTECGLVLGTPTYMSPEQAGVGAPDIDTRTDVYSVGVVLYELLTSRLPYRFESTSEPGLDGVRRVMHEQEPVRASARIAGLGIDAAEVAKHRQADVAWLVRECRRELDWLVLNAIHKERSRRYQTPAALADDIERYLAGHPLRARPDTVVYRTRKFVRRNRGRIVAGAGLAGCLLAGVVAGTIWARQTRRSEKMAAFVEAMVSVMDELESSDGPTEGLSAMMASAASLSDHPATEARVRSRLARIFFARGHLPAAEQELRLALRIQMDRGATGAEVAESRTALGVVLLATGKAGEARAMFDLALAARRRLAPPATVEIIESLNNVAVACAAEGDHGTARRLLREAREVARVEGLPEGLREWVQCNLLRVLFLAGDTYAAELEASAAGYGHAPAVSLRMCTVAEGLIADRPTWRELRIDPTGQIVSSARLAECMHLYRKALKQLVWTDDVGREVWVGVDRDLRDRIAEVRALIRDSVPDRADAQEPEMSVAGRRGTRSTIYRYLTGEWRDRVDALERFVYEIERLPIGRREIDAAKRTVLARVLPPGMRMSELEGALLDPRRAYELDARAWALVASSVASPEQYQLGRALAERAYSMEGASGRERTTLAVAYYRLGMWELARDHSAEAAALNRMNVHTPWPIDLAVEAMSRYRLGDVRRATELLAYLHEVMERRMVCGVGPVPDNSFAYDAAAAETEAENWEFVFEANEVVRGTDRWGVIGATTGRIRRWDLAERFGWYYAASESAGRKLNWEGAPDLARTCARESGKSWRTLCFLGAMQLRAGAIADARATLQDAADLAVGGPAPDQALIHVLLSIACRRLDDAAAADRALAHCEQANGKVDPADRSRIVDVLLEEARGYSGAIERAP